MFKDLNFNGRGNFYFWLTLIFLFALLFVFNVKSYILAVLIYALVLFFVADFGVFETIFFTFLFSLPFEKGIRGWFVEVVSEGSMPWMSGYSFYFGFSLKLIFAAALFLLSAFAFRKIKLKKNSSFAWLIVIFFLFSAVGTFFSESLNLSFLGLVELAVPIFAFLIARQYFRKKRFASAFVHLLVANLFFFGLVGASQLFLQKQLGLFIEDIKNPIYTSSGVFRASGLTGHPTFFASLVSILFPVGAGVFLNKNKGKQTKDSYYYLLALALILGFIATLATISTSALLSLFVVFFLFLRRSSALKKAFRLKTLILSVLTTLVLLVLFFVPAREFISLETAPGRVELARQAIEITQKFPLFGTGLNRFTSVMALKDLSYDVRGFLYPVHNTFLLFFSETGIIAGILFLVFFFGLLYKTYEKANKNWIDFGIWAGVLTFAINAQFHTLFSQDATFAFMMVMLAYLSVL